LNCLTDLRPANAFSTDISLSCTGAGSLMTSGEEAGDAVAVF
jgi:hypothetical protein